MSERKIEMERLKENMVERNMEKPTVKRKKESERCLMSYGTKTLITLSNCAKYAT